MIQKMEQNLQLSIYQLCWLCRRESLFILLAQTAITECIQKRCLLDKMVLFGRKQDSCQSLYFMVFCTNNNSLSSDMVEQVQMSTRKIVANENFITLERDNKMFVTFSSAVSTEKKNNNSDTDDLQSLYFNYTSILILKDTSKYFFFMRLLTFCCGILYDSSNFSGFASCLVYFLAERE